MKLEFDFGTLVPLKFLFNGEGEYSMYYSSQCVCVIITEVTFKGFEPTLPISKGYTSKLWLVPSNNPLLCSFTPRNLSISKVQLCSVSPEEVLNFFIKQTVSHLLFELFTLPD